ncbi:MAG: type I methionyl aminopeptidase [Bdellovibrionales bacterium]|nr:type I methionyl aminopeptidase [Bdellovibrionales bacterium]
MNAETQFFIKGMERAGRLAAETLNFAGGLVRAGITTNEIDQAVKDFTLTRGAKPAPLGYNGYPKSICTSVNDVVCHGVPDDTALKDGDIINVDVTCLLDGFHGDTSKTYFVGQVSDRAKLVTQVAEMARDVGIEMVRAGATTGDIGYEVNKLVTRRGYSVVKEIGGHGIGRIFHDEPFVPSFGKKGRGDVLKPWKCITVEPMVNETDAELIEIGIKGSTIKWYKTGDGTLSAQFEHTILITDTGYEILTRV